MVTDDLWKPVTIAEYYPYVVLDLIMRVQYIISGIIGKDCADSTMGTGMVLGRGMYLPL